MNPSLVANTNAEQIEPRRRALSHNFLRIVQKIMWGIFRLIDKGRMVQRFTESGRGLSLSIKVGR